MWLSGQWFGRDGVERITATVQAEPSISRRALSRRVCEWLGWHGVNGTPRDVSCRKALLELERRGHVHLPACRAQPGCARPAPAPREAPVVAEVCCSLDELGEVDVSPVSSRHRQLSATWHGVMQAHHYLGPGPLCGAQIRYLVRSAVYGIIGALSFSVAAWRLKRRDTWVGWSDRARRANLDKVVCNSRFLIVPSVQVPNLASHVLSVSVRRLAAVWRARYGYEPVLLETFVDGQRLAGTCYRAANWVPVGQTAGRDDGYGNGTVSTGKKDIYVYPLRRDWQRILCREPDDPLALRRPLGDASDWAAEEFAGARLYDERLRQRLYTRGRDFFAQPGALVPQACNGSEAKSKAAYRFFANTGVEMRALLRGHVEATAHRIGVHPVVLAVQDTTTLNYTAHPSTQGLGPINTKQDQGVGLIVHDTLAFSTEGTPLGLVDVQCWARDPKQAGQREHCKQRPIEAKESIKWLRSYRATAELQGLYPDTLLVSVGDREADTHELFQEAQQTESGPKLLVRAERSRNRKVLEDDQACLWEKMATEPVAGHVESHIPRQGSRKARDATLEIRYAAVTLRPPQGKSLEPVQAWAVYAREGDPGPAVTQPLEWLLLTTVAVSRVEHAVERLRWYTLRWGIEVYHRVLKSGCRIKVRQLHSADRIESCLAIDMVVAWRIFWLVKQGRETPALPCDVFFEEDQWQVLCAVVRQAPPPAAPPTLRDAVRMVAKLGGFLGRKCDGDPGPTTLWRGLQRLDDMMISHRASQFLHRQRDGP